MSANVPCVSADELAEVRRLGDEIRVAELELEAKQVAMRAYIIPLLRKYNRPRHEGINPNTGEFGAP